MAFTALVVDTNPQVLQQMVRTLADAGYAVSVAGGFAPARRQLATLRPDVLVTTVRLDGFNGLHLVIASRAQLHDLIAVVTHGAADALLLAEATAHGAFYLSAPIDPKLFVDLLKHALDARGPRSSPRVPRRWPRKRLKHLVGARLGSAGGLVVDISYGGAQVQLRRPVGVAAEDDELLHRQCRAAAACAAGLDPRGRDRWTVVVRVGARRIEPGRRRRLVRVRRRDGVTNVDRRRYFRSGDRRALISSPISRRRSADSSRPAEGKSSRSSTAMCAS